MRIEGKILGAQNKPIAATVTLTDTATEQMQFLQIAEGENYTLTIDETAPGIFDLLIIFSSPGYKSLSLTVGQLVNGPKDIILEKANTLFLIIAGAGLLYAFSKNKRKKVGALQTQDLMPFLMIAGAVLGFNALSKLLDKLGLGKNPATADLSDPNSPWKPNYWRQFTNFSYSISPTQADQYAQTIHNAFTVFQDDFNTIMGVFSNCKTKANVSYLSDIFFRKYDEDLLSFLGDGGGVLPWDGLSSAHMSELISYVSKLPTN